MTDAEVWRTPFLMDRVQAMLDSYRRLLGAELIPREGSPEDQARALFHAPFVVAAHGIEDDPVLFYGNAAALALWEMEFAAFTRTPSRYTAEPMHRDERARLLERTARDGYVDDYQGVRISSTGKRFRIERAIIWNLHDEDGNRIGQGATFSNWTPLA